MVNFIKHDAKKLKRVGYSWRKPRGRKNKTKVGKKGHRPLPSEGFRSPKAERYRIAGLMPVLVHNVGDVAKLDKSLNVAIIASSVGALKRVKVFAECEKNGIRVMNYERDVKDAEKASK